MPSFQNPYLMNGTWRPTAQPANPYLPANGAWRPGQTGQNPFLEPSSVGYLESGPGFDSLPSVMQPGFGGGQAGDPSEGFSGSIADTTGQFDFGGIGHLAGMVLPGGSFTTGFGRLAQSAFGPHGVVGMEEVGIGHPQWGEKIDLINEAKRRNRQKRANDRARDRGAGPRASGEGAAGGNEGAPAGRSANGL